MPLWRRSGGRRRPCPGSSGFGLGHCRTRDFGAFRFAGAPRIRSEERGSHRIRRCVRSACGNCSIRRIDGINILSSTARTAARALPSWRAYRTIGIGPRCGRLRCAPRVGGSTKIRRIGVFTPSRMRARFVAPRCGSWMGMVASVMGMYSVLSEKC